MGRDETTSELDDEKQVATFNTLPPVIVQYSWESRGVSGADTWNSFQCQHTGGEAGQPHESGVAVPVNWSP